MGLGAELTGSPNLYQHNYLLDFLGKALDLGRVGAHGHFEGLKCRCHPI